MKEKILIITPSKSEKKTISKKILEGLMMEDVGITIINSDRDQSRRFPEEIESMIERTVAAPLEPIRNSPGYLEYSNLIKQTMKENDIKYVVPTTERNVKVISDLDINTPFVPNTEVIDVLQNKYASYNFVKDVSSDIYVPRTILSNMSSEREISDFIQSENEIFVKPSLPERGGGHNMGRVQSLEELSRQFQGFKQESYLLSEILLGSEVCHIITIQDREAILQSSYQSMSRNGFSVSKENKIVNIPEINEFGELFAKHLSDKFTGQPIDGIYSMDFLKNKNEKYVLSEINPGRLPTGIDVFNGVGINYSKIILNGMRNSSTKYHSNIENAYSESVPKESSTLPSNLFLLA